MKTAERQTLSNQRLKTNTDSYYRSDNLAPMLRLGALAFLLTDAHQTAFVSDLLPVDLDKADNATISLTGDERLDMIVEHLCDALVR